VDWLQAIVLGLAQGLTEFLPVSSSAHLRIIPALAGWDDPGAAFTAVVQLGTMAAELLFFRKDLLRIGRAWFGALRRPALRGTLDARLGWYLILGTLPIAIVGLALEDDIETTFRRLSLIGTTLIALALVLLVADRRGRRRRKIADLTLRDGLIMGAAQTLALVPGVSRSGATLSAGLFLGLERQAAARFSFLLSIPAVVLSGLYQLLDILGGEESAGIGAGGLVLATLLAFVSGYLAIAFLLRWVATHSFGAFVAYRLALGVVVLGLVTVGAIS
jgi:undecaprenyl-diphosphatase